jgi:hypothetical protein|tara:strand:- start:87 stop:341 length:255 start_codon:yes stop_codon:yes gene_type:complete
MKKIRRHIPGKQKKNRKAVQERLEKQTASFGKHPKECCVCSTPFERTKETVKTWQVVIKSERVRLTCPDCWDIIEKVVEKEHEE